MFRRLYESFENSDTVFSNSIHNQQDFYNIKVPNLIPSNTVAPKNLSFATQGVNPQSNTVSQYVPNVSQIFRSGMGAPGKQTMDLQDVCTNSSLDELIKNQNPLDPVKCGWMYTPNQQYGAAPLQNRGFLADANSPLKALSPPKYSRFYTNLYKAEQQVLTDKCRALTSCNQLSDPQFAGICGYSTERLTGIPINSNGSAKYPDNINTNSATSAIITSADSDACKAEESKPSSSGSQFVPGTNPAHFSVDCTPNEFGRISVPCFRDAITKAGCSQDGALAVALSGASRTTLDPIDSLHTLDSAKLYNQRSHDNPFQIQYAKDAKPAMIQAMLVQQIHNVYQKAVSEPPTSGLGAAARDLCLKKGDIAAFNFCSEVLDTAPITDGMLPCLQEEFKKQGGTLLGEKYPSGKTLAEYQSKGTFGAAKAYIATLNRLSRNPEGFVDIEKLTKDTYLKQALALKNLRGLTLDPIVERAPESAGFEVFWYSNGVVLKNTIEPTVPMISPEAHTIPDTNTPVTQLLLMSDIRVAAPTSMTLYLAQYQLFNNIINSWYNNNYTMILNGMLPPTDELDAPKIDKPNKFRICGMTNYSYDIKTGSCWVFKKTEPNILKVMWRLSDPSVPMQRFYVSSRLCTPSAPVMPLSNGTLTRDKEGPFLMYQLVGNSFADARCPERFSAITSGTANNRTDDILRSPGQSGFLELASTTCIIRHTSILAWTTLTFAFCLNTVPVAASKLCSIYSGSFGAVELQMARKDNNQVSVSAIYLDRGQPRYQKKFQISLDLSKYYLCVISRMPNNIIISISFYELESAKTIITLNPANTVSLGTSPQFFVPTVMDLIIGDGLTAGLNCNLSWIHLFNTMTIDPKFLKREAEHNWKITKPLE